MANISGDVDVKLLAELIGVVPCVFEPKYPASAYKNATQECLDETVKFYSCIQQDYQQFDDKLSSIIDFLVKLRKTNRVKENKCKTFIKKIKQAKKEPKILRSPSSSSETSLSESSDEFDDASSKKQKFKVCSQHRCNVRINTKFTKCKKHA